jgi:hypothetical protein
MFAAYESKTAYRKCFSDIVKVLWKSINLQLDASVRGKTDRAAERTELSRRDAGYEASSGGSS